MSFGSTTLTTRATGMCIPITQNTAFTYLWLYRQLALHSAAA